MYYYFCLLRALEGLNPSFIWRSILQSRVSFKQDCHCHGVMEIRFTFGLILRFLVWIVFATHDYESDDSKSYSYTICFMECSYAWVIISKGVIHTILNIPLSCFPLTDSWIWHFDKMGKCSIKLAYWVAFAMFYNDFSTHVTDSWWKLWQFHIPSKMLNFICGACRYILPQMFWLLVKSIGCVHHVLWLRWTSCFYILPFYC